MANRLEIPLALVFAVLAVGVPASVTVSCSSSSSPADAGARLDSHSALSCVPDGTGSLDGGACPPFADQNDSCPPGCEPVS